MIMADALRRAGLINDSDFNRLTQQDRAEADREAAARRKRLRYDQALDAMPGGLGYEMRDWVDHNGPLPIDVLEGWVELGKNAGHNDRYRIIAVEWARWLSMFRDHEGTVTHGNNQARSDRKATA